MWGAASTNQSPKPSRSRPLRCGARNVASLARPFRRGLKPARGRAVGPAGTHGFCFMVWTPDRSAFDTKLAQIDGRLALLKERIAESQSRLEGSDGTIARSRVLLGKARLLAGEAREARETAGRLRAESQAERETAHAHRGFVEERRKAAPGTAQPAVGSSR